MIKKIMFTVVWLLSVTVLMANETNDKQHWLQLLEAKKYDVLDAQLSSLQKLYENNASKEKAVSEALYSFENSDPLLEDKLELWVKEKPNSIIAHLVLGLYHEHLGWLSRGSRWSKDTTSQQFAKMRGHFRKANDELHWVIDKNPKYSIAYTGLISLNIARGIQYKTLFKEGIKYNPLSSSIRRIYLSGLLPKWGGSFEEIEDFLHETAKLYSQNSALKLQDGFLEYAHGDKIFTSGEKNAYKKALKYLDKAISKSTHTSYLDKRAQVYKYMKSYDKSIEDYTKALEILPQDSDLLSGRAAVYYKVNKHNLALFDANKAVLYDKMNSRALQIRGFIYFEINKKNEALLDLTDSLVYGYEKYLTHSYLGYIYFYTKKNYRQAAESLKTSSELGNKDSHIWYLITAAQWHNRDCEFVKSADIYAGRCQKTNKCKKKDLEWALKSADFAKKGVCKQ